MITVEIWAAAIKIGNVKAPKEHISTLVFPVAPVIDDEVRVSNKMFQVVSRIWTVNDDGTITVKILCREAVVPGYNP